MADLVIEDLRYGYVDMVKWVEDEGELVSPRGMQTKEIRNATIRLTDPVAAIPVGIGRKLNMKIGAAETTQLIAGVSSATQLNSASNNAFEQFMNEGRLLGAYGPRLYTQLDNVIRMISRDKYTRQAAALVWRGDETTLALGGNKDVPCTVALSWNVRDGKLNASTVMRSNDVWLGVAYDFWMFTRLQMTLAWALGLEVGDYTHHAMSLHIYERDWGKVNDLDVLDNAPKYPGGFTGLDPVRAPADEDTAIARWNESRSAALAVVMGYNPPQDFEPAWWYHEKLVGSVGKLSMCQSCRYFFEPMDHASRAIHMAGECTT